MPVGLRSILRRVAARRARRGAAGSVTDEDHQRVMRSVVDEVAAEVLARGAAKLRFEVEKTLGWTGPTLFLEPRNPAAARVELGASTEATFVVVGPRQAQLELWEPSPEVRGRALRACLEAVIDGRVEAAVERHWSGARSVLTFHVEPDPVVSRGYGVGIAGGDDRYWRESYEPY